MLLLFFGRFWLSNSVTHHPCDPTEFEASIAKWENSRVAIIQKKKTRAAVVKKAVSAEERLNPFEFNPNGLPSSEWVRMGFTEAEARTIKNFESRGSGFFYKEDLKKIYAISDEEYAVIEPYIRIPKKSAVASPDKSVSKQNREKPTKYVKPEPVLVNLNGADTADLVNLYGIGPTFAKRIIAYRTKLGGFYSPTQLLEVYGMDSVRFNRLEKQLILDTTLVVKIDINNVTFKGLLKHPYLEYYTVKSIFNYKDEHGDFTSLEQLKNVKLIYDDLYDKISPYIEVVPTHN